MSQCSQNLSTCHVILRTTTMCPYSLMVIWLIAGDLIQLEWAVNELCRASSFTVDSAFLFFPFLKLQVTQWQFSIPSVIFYSKSQGTTPLGGERGALRSEPPSGSFHLIPVFEVGSPPSCPLAPREGTFACCNPHKSLFAPAAIVIIYLQKPSFQKNLQDVPRAHLCIFKELLADFPCVNDEID